jgi:hypothetical protein
MSTQNNLIIVTGSAKEIETQIIIIIIIIYHYTIAWIASPLETIDSK